MNRFEPSIARRALHRNLAGVLLAASLAPALDTTWIDLEAGRSRESLATTSVPGWIPKVVGSLTDSGTHLLLGAEGIRIDGFRQPQGPWHLFARIRPDAYGTQASWYLENLASTSTWPNMDNNYQGQIQGLDVRLGGGRFYPQARRDPRVSDAEWQATLDYFDHNRNASLSRCLLGFAIATTDPVVNWKEVYSNRCLQAGVWQDLAIGWDGKRISMYLDGVEVSDTNRLIGTGLVPRLDPTTNLFLGIRGNATYDLRRFTGAMQNLRIRSGVLDSALAVRLHLEASKIVTGTCRAVPEIVEPKTLHLVAATANIVLRLQPAPDCQPGLVPDLVLRPGDSLDLMAISLDQSQRRLGGVRIGSLSTSVASLGMRSDSATPFRLKARLVRAIPSGIVAARTSVLEESPWNDDRPMVLVAGSSKATPRRADGTGIRMVHPDQVLFPGASSLRAVSLDGAVVPLPALDRANGLFDVSRLPRGLWILQVDQRRFVLARP